MLNVAKMYLQCSNAFSMLVCAILYIGTAVGCAERIQSASIPLFLPCALYASWRQSFIERFNGDINVKVNYPLKVVFIYMQQHDAPFGFASAQRDKSTSHSSRHIYNPP